MASAEANGWATDRVAGPALAVLATADVWQGRFGDAEEWLERAERVLSPDLEPVAGLILYVARGRMDVARGRHVDATAAYESALRLEALFTGPRLLTVPVRLLLTQSKLLLGDADGARATLSGLEVERNPDVARVAAACAHLAEQNPSAAKEALAPVLDGSIFCPPRLLVEAFILDAVALDLQDETRAAEAAVERALDLAEPDGLVWPFVVAPAFDLLSRLPAHRTAHAALLKDILDVREGSLPSERDEGAIPVLQGLSEGELRVLRLLPSNLPAAEIGRELYLSFHTVKTHMRHIYAKLGVHSRTEAVELARRLGLLAPSSRLR
jgi:LuxR family maltose regulon positive regulatory protein